MNHWIYTTLSRLFVIAFLILVGCDNMVEVDSPLKDSPVPFSEETLPVPQVKDGMLYFKTQENFDVVADYLIGNQEDDGLDKFESGLSPFRSLRTEFDELIDQFQYSENDSLKIERFVEDPVFETLLNQEGMIQIADTIYQVTRDYVYGTHVDNALNLGEGVHKRSKAYLENQVTLSSTAPLVKYEIERGAEIPENPRKNMDASWYDECYVNFTVPPNTKYRYQMKNKTWVVNWWVYLSAGTELKSRKIRRRGILRLWRGHRVEKIGISGTLVYVRQGLRSSQSHAFNFVRYNTEGTRQTLLMRPPGLFSSVRLNTTHSLNHVFRDNPHIKLNGSCQLSQSWTWP